MKIASSFLLGLILLTNSLFSSATPIEGTAPDFTLKSSTGENIRLQEHRGEVVMLNFWASWCTSCRQEMPLLDALYKKYKKLGFTLMAVNVDEDPSLAIEYLKEVQVSFPILYDTTNKVSKSYKVEAMPTTVIIDRDGKMRFLHMGYQAGVEKNYQQEVKRLIRE